MLTKAKPSPFEFEIDTTALLIIDMQRDFLDEGGFGDQMGYDISLAQKCIDPCKQVLNFARKIDMLIIHTREGFFSNLADLASIKGSRKFNQVGIGYLGSLGKALIRGEKGHEIIDDLKPLPEEVVIDKPGHGAFYATELELVLQKNHITHLVICGVITEVCVHSTIREAKDRGYACLVLEDCVGSYQPEFHQVCLEIIQMQNGVFGKVSDSKAFLKSQQGRMIENYKDY